MEKFTYQDVQEAYKRIHAYVPDTPLIESFYLEDQDQHYFFKMESLQKQRVLKFVELLIKC